MVASPSTRDFRLERLAPGVHAAIARETGFGLCNSGIVDLGGATVVFDSMLTPRAGALLARAAERVTGHAPAWVVNSHWHGDHIWGNAAFPQGHVVSSRRVRDVVLRKSRRQFDDCRREFPKELAALEAPDSPIAARDRPQVRSWFEGVLATPKPLRIVPPEVTFENELVLEGSRRSLHLLTYGGGHSPSDVFGYLPDEGIVFTGDLVMVGYHPSVGDGWPAEWLRILGRVQRLRFEQLLPGHGSVGTRKNLDGEVRYLRDLQRIVANAVRRGATLAEAVATPIPASYRDWKFSFMFPDNVRRAFRLTMASRRTRRHAA
jgi:cyclase